MQHVHLPIAGDEFASALRHLLSPCRHRLYHGVAKLVDPCGPDNIPGNIIVDRAAISA
jgi:hypothetical protein